MTESSRKTKPNPEDTSVPADERAPTDIVDPVVPRASSDDLSTTQIPKYADSFGNVRRGYERTLRLGAFADSGRTPRMADVEIAVCFADLRGFTNYVHNLQRIGHDNRVQHFLRAYFRIYPRAVLRAMWDLEPDAENAEPTLLHSEVSKLIIPTTYKNLGDGMMIVWELQETSDIEVQGLTARRIYSIIRYIRQNFTDLTTSLGPLETDAYSKYVSELKMGFGLARGHAWRLDFGRNMPVDYAGSIVNLAARLQGLARPHGVVAQLGFAESLFVEEAAKGIGKIAQLTAPKGLGTDPIDVFFDGPEISPVKVYSSSAEI